MRDATVADHLLRLPREIDALIRQSAGASFGGRKMSVLVSARSRLQTTSAFAVVRARRDLAQRSAARHAGGNGRRGASAVRLGGDRARSTGASFERARPPKPAAKSASATTEKIDSLLRSIAKLIQSHLSDAEAYSQRLDGANARLSEHGEAARSMIFCSPSSPTTGICGTDCRARATSSKTPVSKR